MQQFNVLILSVTVLGNPYGYNFKSPEESSYESNSVSFFLNLFTIEFIGGLIHYISGKVVAD